MGKEIFRGHETQVEVEPEQMNEEASQHEPETGVVEQVKNRNADSA